MRTISWVILISLLAWALAGCSVISDPPAASVPDPSPSSAAVPSAAPETEAPDTETPAIDGPNELQSMSLDEKLGQLIIAGMEGDKAEESTRKLIQDKHVGGVIFYKPNITDPVGLTAYVNQLHAWNRNADAPLLVSVDQEGGRVSRLPGLADFPTAADIGRSGSSEYAAAIGGLLGKASALLGMNMDFAPVLDINSNPDNPVIGDRSYGNTPEIVAQLGLQAMSGIREAGVIPVVKHFPGHGDTAVDSHLALPVIQKNLQQLQSFEWVPFKAAIETGADAVMVGHILFPQLDSEYPSSLSRAVITGQLRDNLQFKGVVITDDLTMEAITDHYSVGEAAVLAVQAGADILLVAHGADHVDEALKALQNAVTSGKLTEGRIDESVTRILQLKKEYGLTDADSLPAPDLTVLNDEIKHAEAAYEKP